MENEFRNEELASQTKTDLNETLSKEKVCISGVYLQRHSMSSFPRHPPALMANAQHYSECTTIIMFSSLQGSHLEQVVKVSRSSKPKVNSTEDSSHSDLGPSSALDDGHIHAEEDYSATEDANVEQDVDRLIDADNNEYVLSKAKGGVALTLDPLLIQVRRKHFRASRTWHANSFCQSSTNPCL